MKKNGILLMISMIVCMIFFCPARVFSLKVYTENAPYANYQDENGLLRGHNIDIVSEIKRRLNKGFKIELIPWARGYLLLQKEPNVALFSTARTHSREELFKWVGPLSVETYILYKKKNSNLNIDSLEDAKKVKLIGCYKDDIREKILIEKGFNNLNSLHGQNTDALNLKMLWAGRIDLWITSPTVLYNISERSGINHKLFEEAFVIQKTYLYVAFSKQTPDGIINEWQAALDDIKQDGTYQNIFSNYPMGNSFMTFDSNQPALDN